MHMSHVRLQLWVFIGFTCCRAAAVQDYAAFGYPDENGDFVLTEEGRKIAEKTPILPEARFWGTKPLGEQGRLKWPTNFARRAVFRNPSRCSTGGGFVLSGDGRHVSVVVLSKEKLIAKLANEFAWHLGEMTGVETKCVTTLPGDGFPAVVFGRDEAARLFDVDLSVLGPETAVVRRKGEWLYIGGNTVGPSHALTYVLESLGCRYLWPGRLGKVIPRLKKVVLHDVDLVREPEFSFRRRQYEYSPDLPRRKRQLESLGLDPADVLKRWRASGVDHPGNRGFWAWHGVDDIFMLPRESLRRYSWGHSFGDYRKRFLESHPEWFALQRDGTRGVYGLSLCLSNEALAHQAAEDKIAFLRAHPEYVGVSICLPDGDYSAPCMCEGCRRLDPPNGKVSPMNVYKPVHVKVPYVSMTDRMLVFANRVAEIVAKELPDRKLCIYAYSRNVDPPLLVRPHPSLVVENVAGNFLDMSHAEKSLAGWGATCGMQVWRPNFLIGFRVPLPQCWAERIFNQLEDAKANGLKGFEVSNVCEQWSPKGFTWYAIAKAMVNHGRESFDDVRDGWCSGFGPAAKTVKRYLAAVEDASWRAYARVFEAGFPDATSWQNVDEKARCLIDELDRRNLPALLSKAEAEASGDAEARERVRYLAVGTECLKRYVELAHAKEACDKARFESVRKEFMDYVRAEAARDLTAVFPVQLAEGWNAPYMKTVVKQKKKETK